MNKRYAVTQPIPDTADAEYVANIRELTIRIWQDATRSTNQPDTIELVEMMKHDGEYLDKGTGWETTCHRMFRVEGNVR